MVGLALLIAAAGASPAAHSAEFPRSLATSWDCYPDGDATHSGAGMTGDAFVPALDPPWTPEGKTITRIDNDSEVGIGWGGTLNRVDGLTPTARQFLRHRGAWLPELSGYQAFGFESRRWSGALEVRLHPGHKAISFGGRWFDETAPFFLPRQAVPAAENTAAALFLREDYGDYLHRRGWTAFAEFGAPSNLGLQCAFSSEEDESLLRAVGRYGPFGGRREFRPNPGIEEGSWTSLRARGIWSGKPTKTIWARSFPPQLALEAVWAGGNLGDGANALRVWGEHRGSVPLAPSQRLGYRLAAGAGTRGPAREDGSRLAPQWQFAAGGVGSLRGHKFAEFHGDRLLLTTLEYGIDPGGSIQTALFLDGGKVWNESQRGTGGVAGSGPLALDGGIGVAFGRAGHRIDIARDLRKKRAPARVTVRLELVD